MPLLLVLTFLTCTSTEIMFKILLLPFRQLMITIKKKVCKFHSNGVPLPSLDLCLQRENAKQNASVSKPILNALDTGF